MKKCQGITQKGKPCQVSTSKKFCYHHQCAISPDLKKGEIGYPWASNFVDWLLPKLKAKKIPCKNPNTGGDYYDITIGKKRITVEWKHLRGQIEIFSDALRPYGLKITHRETDYGYLVSLKNV